MLNLDDDDKGMDEEEEKDGGREVEQTEVKRTRSVAEDGERKRQDSKNGAKSGREEVGIGGREWGKWQRIPG